MKNLTVVKTMVGRVIFALNDAAGNRLCLVWANPYRTHKFAFASGAKNLVLTPEQRFFCQSKAAKTVEL
ncbi:MAG: hypothetical protein HFJ60_02410 [Clostridia bacterium]|jgi:hypothetical protein|nr:hypothetical protein [Clostridia bacterium]